MDTVDRRTRSRMMSNIKSKDTNPEMIIRKMLHGEGFRYRLHDRNLPGKPDLIFRKYNAVIFIHGCFWHRHDCRYFKWPKSRIDFWKEKLNRNADNDRANLLSLLDSGWRVCLVWECSIREADRDLDSVKSTLIDWLGSRMDFMEIRN